MRIFDRQCFFHLPVMAAIFVAAPGLSFAETEEKNNEETEHSVPIAGPEYLADEYDLDTDSPASASFQFDETDQFAGEHRLNAHFRSYYMNRKYDHSPDGEALAVGGWIDWQSSSWKNFASIGATAYTSQKLYADDEYNHTTLLQNGEQSYGGISNIYLQLDHDELSARFGRFEINDPYMNTNDARMIPYSFQGGQVTYAINDEWMLGVGHFTEVKSDISTSYDHLYEFADIEGKNHGVSTFGVRYAKTDTNTGGLFYQHAPDFMDTAYIDYEHEILSLDNGMVALAGQYTRQESVGAQLDGDFAIDYFGTRLTWQQGIVTTQAAYTYYSDTDDMRFPWGAVPGYTAVQWSNSNRAGEKGSLIGIGFDLSEMLTPGLVFSTSLYNGDTPDTGDTASPDVREWDLNVIYTVQEGLFKDLEFWVRNAKVKMKDCSAGAGTAACDNASSLNYFRIMANYTWHF